jgi:phosphatidate cytidylyltransferase
MTNNLLLNISLLFLATFIAGTILAIGLYGWDAKKFFKSQLWVKTAMWLPIFVIFVIVLYLKAPAVLAVSSLLVAMGIYEFRKQSARSMLALIYLGAYIVCVLQLNVFFAAFSSNFAVDLLVLVCLSSVLSDVFAFFAGKYFGKTKLPEWINGSKAWEGVAGQIIGALIGYVVVSHLITSDINWGIGLVIGVSSAAGDLINSAAKRSLKTKDWGNSIPGHGGYLDRFSSLSFAIAGSLLFVLI